MAAGRARQWLESKGHALPPDAVLTRLGVAVDEADAAGRPEACALLARAAGAALRERERRALARHVLRLPPAAALASAEEESDEDDNKRSPAGLPADWPVDVEFVGDLHFDAGLPAEAVLRYRGDGESAPRRPAACRRVRIARITDPSHPACGERGLFAALPLRKGTRVIDYLGRVCADNPASDYVADYGDEAELAIDAARMGNEARFINDYRNTGRRPNADLRNRRRRGGGLRLAVYAAADIATGEEVLVSYGKPFWKARVGADLGGFVRRYPAAGAPVGATGS